MFRKLKWQLTLSNLGIIFLISLVLILGTFCLMHTQITRRSEIILNNITTDLTTNKISDIPIKNGHVPSVFFVIADKQGNIARLSSSATMEYDHLSSLVQETLKTSSPKGNIVIEQGEYAYLKTPVDEKQETLIVFQDFNKERAALRFLITALGITGLACLILSFIGSVFMASRVMIPIQKAWQQQKNFLADASHELRTPLAIIQTNLDIVRANQEEKVASQEKWLNNIQEATTNMTKLVDSLLFLARADSHEQLLVRDCFYLNQAVMTAVEPFKPVAESKGICVEVKTESAISYFGDEKQIKQLIGILLDNAIRHTPSGGKVAVHLHQANKMAILSVSDTGEGIGSEHLNKIFERFYQVDQSRSKGGAGLGLAIAKWIVENHHGTISALSSLNEGTTMIVKLPVEK